MAKASQIPRTSILWLLVVQSAVMVPHINRLSWWMLAIWLLCAFWRLAMFRGEAAYPSFFLRTIVVMLGSIGIAVSFGQHGALDIAVAALIFAFSLKLIEVRQRRDLYLVFYLAFFVIAASFLYSQTLLLVAYQFLTCILVCAGLVATQQASKDRHVFHSFKIASKLSLQAVPLLLLFFFMFPRLGPIWGVSESSMRSKTGMSDSMSPGAIVELSRSAELVFSVDFENAVPPKQALYWRGMTYENFDGLKWTRGTGSKALIESNETLRPSLADTAVKLISDPLYYEITLPPTGSNWLFLLPIADFGPQKTNYGLGLTLTTDFNYETVKPAPSVSIWKVKSYLNYKIEPVLTQERYSELTKIPEDLNPRSIQLANELWNASNNVEDYARRIAKHFREEDFHYTLKPDALGEHTVDDFLFETRNGFCEHYSSATAVLFRAVGIPTRVVVGYQGGDENPVNGLIQIRQLDAHAWIEYWERGVGWQRMDPTAAVAPERVHLGLREALEAQQDEDLAFYDSVVLNDIRLLKMLRQRMDAINYAWQRSFVNFDMGRQQNVLSNWFGEITRTKMSIIMLTAMTFALGSVGLFTLRRRKLDKRSAENKLYTTFCDRLEKMGITRKQGEAPHTFAERVVQARPDLSDEVLEITRLYQQIAYQELPQKSLINRLASTVHQFTPSPQSSLQSSAQ